MKPFFFSLRELMRYSLEYDTLQRALKTALFIGTILGIINHGQAALAGHLTSQQVVSILVTYVVPFSVSLWSQIQGKRQRDHQQAALFRQQEPATSSRP